MTTNAPTPLGPGFTLGAGIFETIRAVDGRPQRWADHRARLLRSHQEIAEGRWLPDLASRDLYGALLAALAPYPQGEARIRLMVAAGPTEGEGRLVVEAAPMPSATATRRLGVRAQSVPWRPPLTARWKTTSHLPYLLAGRLAAETRPGAEALLVDAATHRVLEGATWNVFVVRDRTLITPPADGALLPGIARAQLMRLAEGEGWTISESPLHPHDLHQSDGILITNALITVAPLTHLDGAPLPDAGALAARFRDLWPCD